MVGFTPCSSSFTSRFTSSFSLNSALTLIRLGVPPRLPPLGSRFLRSSAACFSFLCPAFSSLIKLLLERLLPLCPVLLPLELVHRVGLEQHHVMVRVHPKDTDMGWVGSRLRQGTCGTLGCQG